MVTYEQIKFRIIWKLYHHHYIGGKHTAIENIPKGLPTSEHGACMGVVEDLVREGLLILKKTSYGMRVSLNKKRIKEIREWLEQFNE